MKVVFDTNVLVSLLLFKGRLSALFDLVVSGNITLCFTPTTFSELEHVLRRKKFVAAFDSVGLDVGTVLSALKPHSAFFPDPEGTIDLIVQDPSDNAFLGAALVSRASYLVSGDKHLLSVIAFGTTNILSPRKFLEVVEI